MRQILFIMTMILIMLAPILAEDVQTQTESTAKCPYLEAKAAAGETPDPAAAARCPVAGKAHDGKGCCAKMQAGCCAGKGKSDAAQTGAESTAKMACCTDKEKAACCAEKEKAGSCAGKTGMKCPVTGKMTDSKTVVQTKCPVMGEKINKKYYVDHGGKRVYLCCPACIDKVKADPEKYITMLEKEGVELEKVEV